MPGRRLRGHARGLRDRQHGVILHRISKPPLTLMNARSERQRLHLIIARAAVISMQRPSALNLAGRRHDERGPVFAGQHRVGRRVADEFLGVDIERQRRAEAQSGVAARSTLLSVRCSVNRS